jgi:hypothetical protein
MIEILIFHLHFLAGLFAFTKYWQNSGIKEAVLATSVVALVFVVGWSIAGTIATLIYPETLTSIYFNKDTFGLILLIIPESIFFYLFFIKSEKVKN